MHLNLKSAEDRKAVLSTLWIFAVLNYLYCDLMGLMDAPMLKQYLEGNVGGMQITHSFLLGAAVLMEIPIAMVLLTRTLGYRANRWANISAGILMTLVQTSTLFMWATPTVYYQFFSLLEIACTAFIVWKAWTWPYPDAIASVQLQPVAGTLK